MLQLQVELSHLPVVREGGISRQPVLQLNKQFIDLAALDLVINSTNIKSQKISFIKRLLQGFSVILKALVSDILPPCKLYSRIWFTFSEEESSCVILMDESLILTNSSAKLGSEIDVGEYFSDTKRINGQAFTTDLK